MTNQEAFNRVVTHLRLQGAKSMSLIDGSKVCRYRGDNGRRCAVGVLITDEFYSPEIEGKVVYSIRERIANALPRVSLDLLGEFQYVHDVRPIGYWEYCWQHLAIKFNLTVPLLPTEQPVHTTNELVMV